MAYAEKPGKMANVDDVKNVGYYRRHIKGHYANKCRDAKPKDRKRTFKV